MLLFDPVVPFRRMVREMLVMSTTKCDSVVRVVPDRPVRSGEYVGAFQLPSFPTLPAGAVPIPNVEGEVFVGFLFRSHEYREQR